MHGFSNCAPAMTAVMRAMFVKEAALLRLIEEAVKTMLTRCFQNYHAVSDRAPTGILEGDMANPESPSSVLRHAVKLAGDDILLAHGFGALSASRLAFPALIVFVVCQTRCKLFLNLAFDSPEHW